MQTIKTSVVVALLLAVCYGAFVALNAPDPQVPDELKLFAQSNDELEGLLDIEMGTPTELISTGGLPTFTPPATADTTGLPAGGLSLPSFDGMNAVATPSAAAPAIAAPEFPSIPGPNLLGAPNTTPPLPGAGQTSLAASPTSDLPAFPSLPTSADMSAAASDLVKNAAASAGNFANTAAGNSLNTDASGNSDFTPLDTTPVVPKFSLARAAALKLASEQGELRQALTSLSPYYNSPELTYTEHSDLVNILDGLALEVIYSKRHLLLPSHVATGGDSVASVAEKYSMNPALVSKINELGSAKAITPGTKLKVVQGPFRAVVSLSREELTLFLGDMYAGRFPVSFGKDPHPTEGKFEVVDRKKDRTYYGTGGTILSATDPRNPYGGIWINLGRDLCIHGTPERESSDLADAGCISLAPIDAADVYDILSQSSQISIVK